MNFVIEKIEEGEDDPRKPSLFLRHSLTSMLFMVVVAITCGAYSSMSCAGLLKGVKNTSKIAVFELVG